MLRHIFRHGIRHEVAYRLAQSGTPANGGRGDFNQRRFQRGETFAGGSAEGGKRELEAGVQVGARTGQHGNFDQAENLLHLAPGGEEFELVGANEEREGVSTGCGEIAEGVDGEAGTGSRELARVD